MNFSISNEPVTGKARILEITAVNLTVGHQVKLVDADNDNALILAGEVKSFSLGNTAMAAAEAPTQAVKDAQEVLKGKIEQAFAEYYSLIEA